MHRIERRGFLVKMHFLVDREVSYGTASAEVNQALQNLLNGINTGEFGKTLGDKGADFFNKMNAGKVVGAAGDQINDAFDNFDAGGKARRVGDELRDAR